MLYQCSVYYYFCAKHNFQLNRFREAIVDCQKAIELDKSSVKGYYFLGRCQIQLESYEDAIKALAKAIDLTQNQQVSSLLAFGLSISH